MGDYTIERLKIKVEGTKTLSPSELLKVAKTIKLNRGKTGFVKVMYRYYEKVEGLGDSPPEDKRYERPASLIPKGAFCEFCETEGRLALDDETFHEENCENPHDPYLLSTVGLFKKELVNSEIFKLRTKTDPELVALVERWKNGTLTDTDISETFGNGVKVNNGKTKVTNSNQKIDIKYRDLKPLSGMPLKLILHMTLLNLIEKMQN